MNLKSIKPHIGYDQYSNILEANLVNYWSWEFLQIGGWTEISIDEQNHEGDNFSRLRSVSDPAYDDGQVWESARKDWVWESGVEYTNYTGGIHNPLPVDNLQVNGTGISGGFIINYPDGRIVFDTAIPTTSVVKVQHSFRDVQVISANSNLWKQIQQDTHAFNDQFLSVGSGDWDILSKNRVQLPLVVVEVDAVGRSAGFELGNHAKDVERDVLFFILAENKPQRNNLMDIIANQSDEYIWLFDTNQVAASGEFPLDYNGSKVKNSTYPTLISETGYRWRKTRMEDAQIINVGEVNNAVYQAVVKTTFSSVL